MATDAIALPESKRRAGGLHRAVDSQPRGRLRFSPSISAMVCSASIHHNIRPIKHLLLALEEFRSLGIQFISYNENIDTSSPLGQAFFTIVSAVAQLERDLIRERVSTGIRNARAKGRKFGRPMRAVDHDRIVEMRAQGQSLRRIAENVGVGHGTVRERPKNSERKPPHKTGRERPTIKDT